MSASTSGRSEGNGLARVSGSAGLRPGSPPVISVITPNTTAPTVTAITNSSRMFMRPTLLPRQGAFAPGIEQSQCQDADEDRHFGDHGHAALEVHQRPGEQEHGLHGEKQVEVRVKVVADVHLRPP